MALVFGVMARDTAAGSRFSVSSETSTRTGRAPTCSTTLAVAQKVMEGTMTSSPGPMPIASRPTWRPAVQELSATTPGAWRAAFSFASNCLVFGPVVIQSEFRVSGTSLRSSSPMDGGLNDKNRSLMISPSFLIISSIYSNLKTVRMDSAEVRLASRAKPRETPANPLTEGWKGGGLSRMEGLVESGHCRGTDTFCKETHQMVRSMVQNWPFCNFVSPVTDRAGIKTIVMLESGISACDARKTSLKKNNRPKLKFCRY